MTAAPHAPADWIARAKRIALERAGDGILRHLPGGSAQADRRLLAATYGVTEDTVRRKLTRAAVDPATGRALYDITSAADVLSATKGRPGGRIPRHVRAARQRAA